MENRLSEKLIKRLFSWSRHSEGSSGRVAGSFTRLRKSFREKRLSSGGGGGSADCSRENTPVGSLNITGQ